VAAIGLALIGSLTLASTVAASTENYKGALSDGPPPPGDVHHDVSPPLRDIPPAEAPPADQKKEKEPKKGLPVPAPGAPDPVVQSTPGDANAPALGLGFEGVGQGFSGPAGTFTVTSAPPDPNGAVGPNHFVEIVNQSFAIFNKSGTPVYGPAATNTLWSGFGGGCQTNDDGDATVAYDKLANRWIISQFSVSTTPHLQCVAVSTSGDPTGSYYRYSFQYNNFPDYPKLGVWPDAYYTTFNMFNNAGTQFLGPQACAYDRAKMLQGQAATQQCFTLSSSFGSLLPSDVDGPTPPPSGSPNFLLSFGTNSLKLWKFHVDWTTPANSSLTGPTTISVASFSPACSGGGTCIPQSGTTQKLDSLADRLMYRLAYRNFGDHESLVVDHSVTAGSSVGVRWYELRNPNGSPTVFQQGTYAPDSSYRWMGSLAMDQLGDIALGYSISSSSLHPGIHYTGRLAGDPLGVMTQGEGSIIDGAGSQTANLSRWGDYTSMSVDPADDCTFWYTNEYIASNGTFNWHTRIGSFKFANCNTAPSDFSIASNPSSLSVAQGATGTSTISTAVTSGSAQTVGLSASGQPVGTTVSFSPASVTAGGSSTMTVNVGASTVPGSYTVTVTGTGTSATHTTTISLIVIASDFSISASPSTLSVAQGASGNSTISTTVISGAAQSVSLSASGQPAGTTVSFSPASVTTGGSSTMSVNVGASTTPGSYTVTVTGTGASATHTTTVDLTVTASDFSISASPSSLTIQQGGSGASTISTAVTSGAAQTVSLSASGQPAGVTITFGPSSVTAGGSSTMTVNIDSSTTTGDYPITVTGTGTSATHATTVTLSVTAAPPSDFSISANPSSLSIQQGGSGMSTISTAVTSGSAQTVTLSASGQPAGVTITFNPSSVTAGGSSTMTVNVDSLTTPGSYPIVVMGTSSSATHTTSVSLTVTAAPPSDFAITASPSSLTVTQGASGTSTIGTAVLSGSAQTVSFSASGQPAGTTVSFNPTSVTAGGSSTMTVSVGATTTPGGYTITVSGTAPSATHSVNVSVTVTAAPQGVVNGGFETGSLSGWTASGAFTPVVGTTAHSGSYSARLGSTSAVNGDSTLTQTVLIPSGTSRLTFWYQPHCTDTITYDQIQMQIRNTSGATLATVLNVCSNSGAWTSASYDTSALAGQTVVLWFNDHDDGWPTDPTYFLLDDVAVGNYAPAPSSVQNPGFETGSLSSWSAGGAFTPVISTTAHSGSYSARLGSTSAVNGDSTLTQSVTVPAGSSTLSFWYQPHCTDTITYDQIQMQIRNASGATLATVLNACSNSGAWTQATFNTTTYAGQTVVLWFNDHDDGYPTDPTYFLLDDVSIG